MQNGNAVIFFLCLTVLRPPSSRHFRGVRARPQACALTPCQGSEHAAERDDYRRATRTAAATYAF